ncbi:uncharacterized protein BX663DRAFT_175317 [Cokeromyces recurvatus]|uniref:uncharacterized protein n=1 Tax=Cokeromyces recurvatus TaxID=90255 RepID=UPI002220FE4B|nr:uncharacterized protein BX663DRAFT_175317 [Cokeromyces recurvatus]KAI7899825.1 hypothetical protein BX663DRAFT_175317 [Cokeromyces recurvatus]
MRFFPVIQQRFYSTCQQLPIAKPLNQEPIGYLVLPGLVKYDEALKLQSYLVSRRHKITQKKLKTKVPADLICFLEHTPTYTAGRRIRDSKQEEIERLKSLGADYYETMRGGQITFHGPGQLIAYPILDIRDYQLNVKCYVSSLEKTVIDCCAKYGIKASTTENTGVWIRENDKIAALGIHLQRYVSSHGFALNCNVDLDWFKQIIPCGLEDKGTTSISKETNLNLSPKDVIPNLVKSFETLFRKPLVPIQLNQVYLN